MTTEPTEHPIARAGLFEGVTAAMVAHVRSFSPEAETRIAEIIRAEIAAAMTAFIGGLARKEP